MFLKCVARCCSVLYFFFGITSTVAAVTHARDDEGGVVKGGALWGVNVLQRVCSSALQCVAVFSFESPVLLQQSRMHGTTKKVW